MAGSIAHYSHRDSYVLYSCRIVLLCSEAVQNNPDFCRLSSASLEIERIVWRRVVSRRAVLYVRLLDSKILRWQIKQAAWKTLAGLDHSSMVVTSFSVLLSMFVFNLRWVGCGISAHVQERDSAATQSVGECYASGKCM